MLSLTSTDDYIQSFINSGIKTYKPGNDFFFKKTQLPFIGKEDPSSSIKDFDLKKLDYAMIKDTYAHRMYCFFKDNVTTSWGRIFVSVILGEGITVSTLDEDKQAEQIIADWNDEINVRHESIEDLIRVIIIDNLINAESLHRIFINLNDDDHKVDLQRVSMENVSKEIHPTFGWRRFIQTASVPDEIKSKNVWYRGETINLMSKVPVKVIIPDELQTCFYLSLFDNPPVSSILDFLVLKRWIIWFTRKYAEKFWAPFLIAYVGDPQNGYMPNSRGDMDESLSYAAEALRKVRSYGVAAFLGTTKVDVLDTKTQKNADIYVDYLEHCNKEIMLGLFSSISLREGERQRAENSGIAQQGTLRFIRGIREAIGIKLRKLYAKVVLPAYGVNKYNPSDLTINFPQLQLNDIKDVIESINIAAKTGVFKDIREIRKIVNPIWRHIHEKNITDEDAKEMWNLFLEINSPSRNETDAPQQRVGKTVE